MLDWLRDRLRHNRIAFLHDVLYSGTSGIKWCDEHPDARKAIIALYKKVNVPNLYKRKTKEAYLESVKDIWAGYYESTFYHGQRTRRRAFYGIVDVSHKAYEIICVNAISLLFFKDIDKLKENVLIYGKKLNYCPAIYLSKDVKKISRINQYTKSGQPRKQHKIGEDFYRKLSDDINLLLK